LSISKEELVLTKASNISFEMQMKILKQLDEATLFESFDGARRNCKEKRN
jgi:hypothetical protein